MSKSIPTIGIDFGTTNSVMAWLNPSTSAVEVIRNIEHDEATPSVVYYGDSETLIGRAALEQLESALPADSDDALSRSVCSIKRRIGDRHLIPLPDGRDLTPVDVVADVLEKLRRDAKVGQFNNHSPTHVVLTHPAAFSTRQRKLLVNAAERAGFEEIELLAEPEAAAMHFAKTGVEVGNGVLVFDLGGGTFDLAYVANHGNGRYRLAMEQDGDANCGGDDFDLALYQHWSREVEAKTGKPIDDGDGQIDLHFLYQCRRRKENLSIRDNPAPFRSQLSDGRIVKLEIDRTRFEALIKPHVERTVERTQRMYDRITEAGHKVDTLLLIGGAAQVPMVRKRLNETLPLEPRLWNSQGVAVASGAAAFAHRRWSDKPNRPHAPANDCKESGKERSSLDSFDPLHPWRSSFIAAQGNDPNEWDSVCTEPAESSDEDQRWSFIDILNRVFGGLPSIYIAPSIPDRKLDCVRELYPGEDILLVYDYTSFGSAKDGFVITRSGVGWRNGIGCTPRFLAFNSISRNVKTTGFEWGLLKQSQFELAHGEEVYTWNDQSNDLAAAFRKALPMLIEVAQHKPRSTRTKAVHS